MSIKTFRRLLLVSLILSFAGILVSATAQSSGPKSQVPSRIVTPVDDSVRVTVPRSTHPLAQPAYDIGPLEDTVALKRMILVMAPSSDQEQELLTFLDSQHTKGSADYHHWLTADEFGARFGPSLQDVQQVTAWLRQKGFSVDSIARGGRWLEFSGTAGQVRKAFGTQIRQYQIAGKMHLANSSALSVPAALSPVVRGVASLHDFFKKPMLKHVEAVRRNAQGQLELVHPDLTVTSTNGTFHFLAPSDYAKIYDLNPLYNANLKGQNQTIAIVARSNINVSDINQFSSTLDWPMNTLPVVILNGPDPGVDIFFGDGIEATVDTEWATAVAPGATVKLVVSQSTLLTDGVDLSASYIVENPGATETMSISFGACEKDLGSAENAFWNALFQQAAAEGISVFVSAGDNGNAGCDDPNPNTTPAQGGAAVSGLASTPFNTAVGGTEFNENGQDSTFWNTTNSKTDFSSVTGYIPEVVWNESCSPMQANTDCAGENFYELFAGSGGVSTLYAKPSWQNTNIQGVPNDGQRDLPDVSLAAAALHDGILFCFNTGFVGFNFNCLSAADGQGNPILTSAGVVGGTSLSSPSFAGIMALVDQKTGGRQGLANYVLYQLAGAANFSSCNSSNRTNPGTGTSCVFNDVTAGNNDVPGQTGFTSAQGFDMATGLGSVDANNLVNAWASVASGFQATQTTLTAKVNGAPVSSISIQHGQTVSFNSIVARQGTAGTPSGAISLIVRGNFPDIGIVDEVLAPSGTDGTATTGDFNVGTLSTKNVTPYGVFARYPGDGKFGASESAAISLIITPENSSTTIMPKLIDESAGTISGGTTVPYGNINKILFLDTTVAGLSGQGFPGGVLVFNDGASQITGGISLNNRGLVEFIDCLTVPCFTVGTHTITANYSGDEDFNASNSGTPLTITVTKGDPFVILLSSAFIAPGTQTSVRATVRSPLGAIVPTGTVQFFDGTTALGGPVTLSAGTGIVVFTPAAGTHSITATYSGDDTYNTVTSFPFKLIAGAPFSFAATITSQTIPAGGTATYNVTLTKLINFSGLVSFTCTGAPGGATCTVSPNPANVPFGVTPIPLVVTVSNTANAQLTPGPFRNLPFVFAGVLGVMFAGMRRKPKQRLFLVLAIFCIVALGSCGGGGGSGGGGGTRAPTNATLTVTGTMGSVNTSINLTLTVTH